eukprot:TRINITY_DN9675_c0_g1_i2.p1 TRINITY_DN9675_c0_g1~~TRINITY_DN9675_c0_g1_i2.p1  ORF type:complete len:113 (-),score=15.82 TRINITY_DN9675_c0_g1_i2:155-493(-)
MKNTCSKIVRFQVTHVHFQAGRHRRFCFSKQGPSLGFTWRGSGQIAFSGDTVMLEPGVVFFLASDTDADISADETLDIFVACCPPHYFQDAPLGRCGGGAGGYRVPSKVTFA